MVDMEYKEFRQPFTKESVIALLDQVFAWGMKFCETHFETYLNVNC